MAEAELRLQVVVPLLRATPGVTNVTDVHGQNERGLDIIFFVSSEIEELCYGLQLKVGQIAGGGTGKRTVKQIVDQLELASDFDHPVATKNAGTYRIDKFVVCTNGQISNTAREEIGRRIKRSDVVFWDGDELVRRVHRFIPQLFHVSDGGAVDYLKAVVSRAETLDSLDQIPGVAKRTLSQIFVEPELRRKFDPSLGSESAGGQAGALPALSAVGKDRLQVIVADQDAGKTALLRMHVIKQAEALLSGNRNSKGALPILLRAKDILARGLSVVDAIRGELRMLNGDSLLESLEADLRAGHYSLVVDGFSEFLKEEDKSLAATFIEEFAEDYSKVPLVVAARPVDFLRPKYLANFYQYTIDDFSSAQVTSLIRAWTGDAKSFADLAEKMVDRLREALQLPGSPIPAMIGVMLHEEQGRFITNTAEAIDRYMVIRLGRYAHELGMRQEIDWTRKQDLLAEVAYQMVCEENDTLTRNAFVAAFNAIYERQGEVPRGETALNEMLDSGILVADGAQLGFHRTSFRDFFAAHHVVQLGDFDSFVVENLYSPQWGGVLVFAAGLRRRNSTALTRVAAAISDLRSRALGDPGDDYYYAAYVCGRLLSNSEAADEEPRRAALRTFLHGAGDALPGLEEVATEQYGNIGHLLALLGIEQTVFTTIGVPWLRNQFKDVLEDLDLPEEERHFLASTYAQLGYPDAFQVLNSAAREIRSTRGLYALDVLVQQLQERKIEDKGEAEALTGIRTLLRRRLSNRGEQIEELLKVKSQALEIERKRLRRIMNKNRKMQ